MHAFQDAYYNFSNTIYYSFEIEMCLIVIKYVL